MDHLTRYFLLEKSMGTHPNEQDLADASLRLTRNGWRIFLSGHLVETYMEGQSSESQLHVLYLVSSDPEGCRLWYASWEGPTLTSAMYYHGELFFDSIVPPLMPRTVELESWSLGKGCRVLLKIQSGDQIYVSMLSPRHRFNPLIGRELSQPGLVVNEWSRRQLSHRDKGTPCGALRAYSTDRVDHVT